MLASSGCGPPFMTEGVTFKYTGPHVDVEADHAYRPHFPRFSVIEISYIARFREEIVRSPLCFSFM